MENHLPYEVIEQYLLGELKGEALARFETSMKTDPRLAQAVKEYRQFMQVVNSRDRLRSFRKMLRKKRAGRRQSSSLNFDPHLSFRLSSGVSLTGSADRSFHTFLRQLAAGDPKASAVFYEEYRDAFVQRFRLRHNLTQTEAAAVFSDVVMMLLEDLRSSRMDFKSKEELESFLLQRGLMIWKRRVPLSKKLALEESSLEEISIDRLEQMMQQTGERDPEVFRFLREKMEQLEPPCREMIEAWLNNIPARPGFRQTGYSSFKALRAKREKCLKQLLNLMKEDDRFEELFR